MPLPIKPNVLELAQLRDIHMPLPISSWPLAPGYYLLAVMLIVIFAGLIYFGLRCLSYGRACRHALNDLSICEEQHKQSPNSQKTCAMVSELLKRTALAYYPRPQVAGLQGEAWLTFLNDKLLKNDNFSLVRDALLEYPYQHSRECDLTILFKLARSWIKLHKRQKPIGMRSKCLS